MFSVVRSFREKLEAPRAFIFYQDMIDWWSDGGMKIEGPSARQMYATQAGEVKLASETVGLIVVTWCERDCRVTVRGSDRDEQIGRL
jgi:hypothetical protein